MALVRTTVDTFLGLEEAARALQCSPETVADLAGAGALAGTKVGRAWVFLASDIVAFLRARRTAPCESTAAPARRTGTPTSASVDGVLDALVGPPTARRPGRSQRASTPRRSSEAANVVPIADSTKHSLPG